MMIVFLSFSSIFFLFLQPRGSLDPLLRFKLAIAKETFFLSLSRRGKEFGMMKIDRDRHEGVLVARQFVVRYPHFMFIYLKRRVYGKAMA